MMTTMIDMTAIDTIASDFSPILAEAAEALQSGDLVAFPTETVYGLGANALDSKAVRRIFEAKGRPSDNPLIVHVHSVDQIDELVADIPSFAHTLIRKFMPGPITLVFRKSDKVPGEVTAGLDTVAIRIPSHPVARLLIKMANVPVAAPSANLSGRPSPTDAFHVMADLEGRIPFIINGGSCEIGLESTVVDVTGAEPVILRPGAVTAEEIAQCCGTVSGIGADFVNQSGYSNAIQSESPDRPRSPGMKYRHYAPKAEVILPDSQSGLEQTIEMESIIRHALSQSRQTGVFASADILENLRATGLKFLGISYGDYTDASSAASHLFGALRKLDELGVDLIVAQTMPVKGMGTAYMNRLLKAASGKTEQKSPECRVLFVCTGNTCRSPMAEYYFNHTASILELNKCSAVSAGISTLNGLSASEGAYNAMKDLYDIDLSEHRSSRIHEYMLKECDLVLTMQESHKAAINKRWPEFRNKVSTLHEYADGINADIADPFGGSADIYENCARQIASLVDKTIDKIKKINQ